MNKSQPKPTVDLGYPTEARGRIPSFNSIEEEAEWWDTHDSGDYDEEFVPVGLTVGPGINLVLRVPLNGGDIDEIGRRADEMGVGITGLARMWIEERLKKEAS
jgi:hypothetical protein